MKEIVERITMLKQTPVFSDVSTDDLRIVATALEDMACFAGERVFEIYDRSDKVYFIRSGSIGISIDPDPTNQDYVVVLGQKDCFGEMSMFDDKPRSATAHVIKDSVLLALDKTKLRGLITSYPDLALGMLRALSTRLREINLEQENRK